MSKHRHKMQKKAMGGSMKENVYNAVGSPEVKESHEKESGFKKGGKAKKKAGGKVEHGKSHHRADKKPRRAAGGPVYSSASKKSAADKSEAGQGHEGDGPKGEDPDRGCYAKGGKVDKWIGKMHMKKGAFTKQADRAGKSVHEMAEEKKDAPGKTGKRARLALTFEKMRG